jgi:hypothetical protein
VAFGCECDEVHGRIPAALRRACAARQRRALRCIAGDTRIEYVPSRVVSQCLQAHRTRNWEQLRKLLHPDAQIGVFAAGGKPADPEAAIAAMEGAHEDTSYHADVAAVRTLDENAVLLTGRVEYRSTEGEWIRGERVWLYIVVDNLLYRSQVFETEAEAQETYARLGIDLGVPSPS